MISSSTDTISADRLSSYVDELRWFSTTYQLPWGKPEDLQALCDRLADEKSFLVDFEAMIRSIIYRENCRTTLTDLLGLVGLAWGGPDLPMPKNPLQTSTCDLAAFLQQAMQLPQFQIAEPTESDEVHDASRDGSTSGKGPSLVKSPSNDESSEASEHSEATPVGMSRVPPKSVEPGAMRTTPWWAESAARDAFAEPAQEPEVLLQNEFETSRKTEALAADPWVDNSTFHQELLRFAERRREAMAVHHTGALSG